MCQYLSKVDFQSISKFTNRSTDTVVYYNHFIRIVNAVKSVGKIKKI